MRYWVWSMTLSSGIAIGWSAKTTVGLSAPALTGIAVVFVMIGGFVDAVR